MALAGQIPQSERYTIIPRSLTFLLADEQVLLIELSESKGSWAGKLNGVGGHIEQGEHPLRAAKRELKEETGLEAHALRLCGVVLIDTKEVPGIGLYVFVGEASGELTHSPEGKPQWHPLAELKPHQLVADLPTIMPLAIDIYQHDRAPFSALYRYTRTGELRIELELPFDED